MMRPYTLNEKLHWNAVKHHELADGFVVSPASATRIAQGLKVKSQNSMQEKLNFRAKYLDDGQFLKQAISKVKQSALISTVILIVLALVLGWVSTSVLLSAQSNRNENTINFYGVLIGLLGANTLALLFWLLLLFFKSVFSPIQGVLKLFTQRCLMFAQKHKRAFNAPTVSDKNLSEKHVFSAVQSWYEFLFQSSAGRWRISTLLHLAWAVFLFGALACVLYKLSIEHYQFVWESTLLSNEVFVWLTQKLAYLPSLFGVGTPSVEHIQHSSIQSSVSSIHSAASRSWAVLLISSLVVYGIAPRLVLTVLCGVVSFVFAKKWLPNFDQPYYQKLIVALNAPLSNSMILDEDDAPTPLKTFSLPPQHSESLNNYLDNYLSGGQHANKHWHRIAFEMPTTPDKWHTQNEFDLGVVKDRDSLNALIPKLSKKTNVVLLCQLSAVPERGTARIISTLRKECDGFVVLLLSKGNIDRARYQQWLALASQAELTDTLIVNEAMDILQP